MNIEDFIRTLKPGECVSVERIAKEIDLPLEDVEREIKSMVQGDPDLEMIVNAQGTFIEVKRFRKTSQSGNPVNDSGHQVQNTRPKEFLPIVLGFIIICVAAFVIGGFFGTPLGSFSPSTGALVAIIAFFVLLFFCYCQNQ